MKKVLALILAAITVFMVFSFAGCGEKDVLVVGVTIYEPMNYKDADGNWTGFDTEFAQAFAEKLGVEVQFQIIDWDSKFFELDSGAIDCIWNGMTITDEARKNSSVSDAYLTNSQVVVLPADEAADIKTVDDLKNLTFAVENDSAGHHEGEANGLACTPVNDMQSTLLEVSSGACDGCIIDKTMANATIGEGTSYENLVVAMTLSTEEYGVSFPKDSDLTAQFNEFLKEYKESGKFAELAAKYEIELED